MNVDRGLLVILEAQQGKEDELAAFLTQAQPLAAAEPGTVTWYAFKLSDTTFGIFDTFSDEAGRQAHLNGPTSSPRSERAPSVIAGAPTIGVPALLDVGLAGFHAGAVQLRPLPRPAGVEDKSGGLLRRA